MFQMRNKKWIEESRPQKRKREGTTVCSIYFQIIWNSDFLLVQPNLKLLKKVAKLAHFSCTNLASQNTTKVIKVANLATQKSPIGDFLSNIISILAWQSKKKALFQIIWEYKMCFSFTRPNNQVKILKNFLCCLIDNG